MRWQPPHYKWPKLKDPFESFKEKWVLFYDRKPVCFRPAKYCCFKCGPLGKKK